MIISQRKHTEYLMQLAIAHNPYSENPEELFEALQLETGASYLDAVEPDRDAMQSLQEIISPNMQR